MVMKPLPYGRQSIDQDDIAAVVAQLSDDWLTQGPVVGRFESVLTEVTGARYAVAVSSGTAALHLACLAAGVGPGDIGLAPTLTFVATANAIRYAGGTPHLVDVEPDSALVSTPALERTVAELVRRHTPPKVIVPVDFSGAVAELPEIARIAESCGAIVIEDAAHALGASYAHGGRTLRAAACAHATMAILSFHPVKHITTCEGGAVTTNDERLYRRLLDLRSHGITKDPVRLSRSDGPWYQEQQMLGYNYRISDVQCALGVSQAKKLPAFLVRRREIAARYDRALRQPAFARWVQPLVVRADVTSAYHLYVVRFAGQSTEEAAATRKRAYLSLREAGIYAQVHYVPLHMQPDFAQFVRGLAFPGADAYYASCLSLPMFPGMTDADVDRVVETLQRIVQS
jgi:UDP-4-amino-4,6-dideoxy-N-acetyl-beta-L-altrosamine transaminase